MPILTETRPGTQDNTEDRPVRAPSRSSGRTLVLVAVFLAIALMLMLPVRSWVSQRSSIDEMQVEIEQAQHRVESLSQQASEWKDPAFIEEQARLRLNLVLAGEAGLLTLDEQAEPAVRRDARPPDTWWGRLWGSVDEVSGRKVAQLGSEASQNRSDAPQ